MKVIFLNVGGGIVGGEGPPQEAGSHETPVSVYAHDSKSNR